MTASDNDVYIKSMHGYIDELKQTHSQQQITASASTAGTAQARSKNASSTIHAAACSKLLPNKTDAPQAVAQHGVTAASNGGPGGVNTWGTSFEQLLQDPIGLRTFAEFLKKEFSAENIYFWTACERFRNTENVTDRITQAMAIFAKHLSKDAHEPINVDSQARNLSEEELKSGALGIFAHAQKQIFNLMKFDSYHRFIRSDLYKSCLEAEEKRQPLPYANAELDELLKTQAQQPSNSAMSKLKKSASNAEDRCRKSLLPWHRKISSSKSRERSANEGDADKPAPGASKLPLLSGSSLKIPSTHSNSISDIHSSRSSLSSFDALPVALCATASSGQLAETVCPLCRVILSDGATTIVQTRSGETVGQLVERLLEKRGLSYQFYDVVANGSSKSIDLQSPSQSLAGKEVMIEQRVAFKLDLPDPKVISVKSRPKKQLHEVIRPILHKYNYTMEAVQVLMRDTHALLDLSLPVTAVDGQRLQIVLLKVPALQDYQNGCGAKFPKPLIAKNAAKQLQSAGAAALAARQGAAQHKLDEITNKVFNELLQGKVEAHANEKLLPKPSDASSLKSDDCASETSSLFDRMRRRDSNTPALRLRLKKKSTSSQNSEEAHHNGGGAVATAVAATTAIALAQPMSADLKKPIIAKLKAGVKLQVTERVAENQDELLEGLKRAQLARLEDQRGTEINFELPDFLKNKENLNAAASKLRKVRASLSPINKSFATTMPDDVSPASPHGERPQPAPRLSITNRNKLSTSVTPMKIDEEPSTMSSAAIEQQQQQHIADTSNSSIESTAAVDFAIGGKGPPPLPPKPKVLPIKPSNWGVCSNASGSPVVTPTALTPTKNYTSVIVTPPAEGGMRKSHLSATEQPTTRFAYLEEPSSSFV